MPTDNAEFRQSILQWYDRSHRALPWREPAAHGRPDPWRVLVSEIMLQQTRVEAVIPYFHRFLRQFPDARSLAQSAEADALAAWSGLGYYSRIRNLRRAAALVRDGFPETYTAIRELPGVGPYTAAAVASIAFDLPYAVADGNVFRVIARYTGDAGDIGSQVTKQRFTAAAQALLDPLRAGDFNQAMMELGATVCLPRDPQCLLCPVARRCQARLQGIQNRLPVKTPKPAPTDAQMDLVVARESGAILLQQRPAQERRMAGFWELPPRQAFPESPVHRIAQFRHTVVNTRYAVHVWIAETVQPAPEMRWFAMTELTGIPLTTVSRKALALVYPVGAIAAGS